MVAREDGRGLVGIAHFFEPCHSRLSRLPLEPHFALSQLRRIELEHLQGTPVGLGPRCHKLPVTCTFFSPHAVVHMGHHEGMAQVVKHVQQHGGVAPAAGCNDKLGGRSKPRLFQGRLDLSFQVHDG